jgi:hypothetical protein
MPFRPKTAGRDGASSIDIAGVGLADAPALRLAHERPMAAFLLLRRAVFIDRRLPYLAFLLRFGADEAAGSATLRPSSRDRRIRVAAAPVDAGL